MSCFDSVYEKCKAAGVIVGHHEDRLFVLDCAETVAILNEEPVVKGLSVRFKEFEHSENSRWIWEVPFAFMASSADMRRVRDWKARQGFRYSKGGVCDLIACDVHGPQ